MEEARKPVHVLIDTSVLRVYGRKHIYAECLRTLATTGQLRVYIPYIVHEEYCTQLQ